MAGCRAGMSRAGFQPKIAWVVFHSRLLTPGLQAVIRLDAKRSDCAYMTSEKIKTVADLVNCAGRDVDTIRRHAVEIGVQHGLAWNEIVALVDELQARTGLMLHLKGNS